MQNTVRGTEYLLGHVDILLRYVADIRWSNSPGFLWYDYEEDRFFPIPHHPSGRENGRAYPSRIVSTNLEHPKGSRGTTAPDYFPQGFVFVPECLSHLSPPSTTPPFLAPGYEELVSHLQVVGTQTYLIPDPSPIRTGSRSIPHLGSGSLRPLLYSTVTNSLSPAFQSVTRFRYDAPSELASHWGTDTAETVNRSLARVAAEGHDFAVHFDGGLLGPVIQSAGYMRNSNRLHGVLD